MKASKFTDAQAAFVASRAPRAPVAEICRNAGISQTTYRPLRCGLLCFRAFIVIR